MLSDQIREWSDMMEPPLVFRHIYETVDKKVKQAHRFVLSRDAVMTIQNISTSEPKRFLDALSICRLPYPSMWVEFVFKDRYDWMMDAAKRGMIIEEHVMASPPSRLGFLLEQQDDDGRLISILPCWSHPSHKTVSICHMALTINTNPDADLSYPLTIEEKNKVKQSADNKVFNQWMKTDAGIDAGMKLEARLSEYVPDFIQPMWNEVMQRATKHELTQLFDLARYDLMAEWRFIMSLLTVLNSRNVIEIVEGDDLTKLNKARIKSHKPPLLAYRQIKLNSRLHRKHSTQHTMDDLQAHYVRGHWKLRRSGLFWWSPFVRGYTGEPPMTTTIVR